MKNEQSCKEENWVLTLLEPFIFTSSLHMMKILDAIQYIWPKKMLHAGLGIIFRGEKLVGGERPGL